MACGSEAERAERRVRVAVSSNFLPAMKELARAFEAETGFFVEPGSASTGRLYAQIRVGAPFDVFLAADADRPQRLVDEGLARATTLRRYATGRLVLIAHVDAVGPVGPDDPPTRESRTPPACLARLLEATPGTGSRLAIASPEIAPYGRAARQTLEHLGAWPSLAPHLVRGENVSQVHHFVVSGNAAAGFVAASQLVAGAPPSLSSCQWLVPEDLHDPIVQKMVALERSADRPAVEAFLRFMQSATAARIIRASGYTP